MTANNSINTNVKNLDDKKELPPSFEPGPYDVICKRGKGAKNHEGNQRYRALIQSALTQYSKADSKMKKSVIVSEIVDFVRTNSPNGGFVKQDEETGEWYEVGTYLAREKTSQCFRDSLHFQYKSSTKAKKRRRDAKKGSNDNKLDCTMNGLVTQHKLALQQHQPMHLIAASPYSPLNQLTADVALMEKHRAAYGGSPACPDILVSSLVSRANLQMLELMKRENDILSRYASEKNRQYLNALVGI